MADPSPSELMLQRERARDAFRRLAPVSRMLNQVAVILLREDDGGQGRHVDPDDPATPPPARARWTAAHAAAVRSPRMKHFRVALRPPGGGSEREGVLDDLSRYYAMSTDEALEHCLDWQRDSLAEWEAQARDSPDGIAAFYDQVRSWSFDLCWYSYLQATGTGYPKSVVVADRLGVHGGVRVLDYGSGVGVTAQFLTVLGCTVTLADVSAPLLEFARFRLQRRGVQASYLRLPAALPRAEFDLVTALDVMVHIPPEQLRHTMEALHATLRPGGLLVAGYDVRRASRANAWHLYEDDLPLRWEVARAGFRTIDRVDQTWIYRAVPRAGVRWSAGWRGDGCGWPAHPPGCCGACAGPGPDSRSSCSTGSPARQ